MAKHKKYEMLLAKAENMDLLIFLKYQGACQWEKSPNAYPPNNDRVKAFLCLPEHEDACHSALNGKKVQVSVNGGDWVQDELLDKSWRSDGWYMNPNVEVEILP